MNAHLISTCVLLSLANSNRAANWTSVINAVGQVESGMLHGAIGDGTDSRGAWQITEAAWKEVNELRKVHKRQRSPWKLGSHNPVIARSYVADLLGLINRRLSVLLGRPPTVQELYAAYNLGLTGFQRRKFMLENCPAVTREAAARVENLCK